MCIRDSSKDKLNVKVENLKTDSISAMILLSERERRLMDMLETYKYDENLKSLYANTAVEETLILNGNNKLVKELEELKNISGKEEETELICRHIYLSLIHISITAHSPIHKRRICPID